MLLQNCSLFYPCTTNVGSFVERLKSNRLWKKKVKSFVSHVIMLLKYWLLHFKRNFLKANKEINTEKYIWFGYLNLSLMHFQCNNSAGNQIRISKNKQMLNGMCIIEMQTHFSYVDLMIMAMHIFVHWLNNEHSSIQHFPLKCTSNILKRNR